MRLRTLLLFVAIPLAANVVAADQPTEIVTPTGRKNKLTRRYELAEVRKLVEAQPKSQDPFEISHPVAPTVEDLKRIEAELRSADTLWYFQGLDSGWVILRKQKPVLVVVVSHEY
jgi:hypothetical protein